jgi:hypothetical protein
MKPKPPKEKTIEANIRKYAISRNCLVYKFTSPAHRSVPDRIIISRATGKVLWLEVKRPGEKPTTLQANELLSLMDAKQNSNWCDNLETAKLLIDEICS